MKKETPRQTSRRAHSIPFIPEGRTFELSFGGAPGYGRYFQSVGEAPLRARRRRNRGSMTKRASAPNNPQREFRRPRQPKLSHCTKHRRASVPSIWPSPLTSERSAGPREICPFRARMCCTSIMSTLWSKSVSHQPCPSVPVGSPLHPGSSRSTRPSASWSIPSAQGGA